MRESVTISVPATTANLGPGFDCLGMALDLWNEMTFTLEGQGIHVSVQGEGQGVLPLDESNLVARAALRAYDAANISRPSGLQIACTNVIPTGSGMGSSASAVLAGLLGANELLGKPLSREEILRLAIDMEGHPDNVSAGLYGGLVVVMSGAEGILARKFDLPVIPVALVLPEVDFPTQAARAALPRQVPLQDAVYNLGRTALVVEALRTGDWPLLEYVMDDRLHQPYRLPLIPGASAAVAAARQAGAAAVALSGAGPSLIALGGRTASTAAAMGAAFNEASVPARAFLLETCNQGAHA